jgi:hypothetical protein
LRIVAALVVVLLTPVYARAQDASVVLAKQIGDLAGSATGDESMVASIRDSLWQVVYLKRDELVSSGQADVAEILTFRRADVQIGSGSGASGTTSAVMDPLLPAIFGMGFENGAITRSVSGSTISIKVAPAGLICAARPLKAAAVARRDDEGCKTFWRRFGVVAAFDTTRGEKSKKLDGLQTLDNQFAGVSVRAEVINLRKATGARYRETFATKYDAWKEAATELVDLDLATPSLDAAQKVVEDQLLALTRKPEWKGLTPEQRKPQILTIVNQAVKPIRVPEAKAVAVRDVWLRSLRADRELENAVANAPVLTAEYAFERPDLATEPIGDVVPEGVRPPSLHTTRAIYAQGLGRTNLDFTANVSASWFSEVRPGMSGRFRDFKAGFEGTFRLRDIANFGAPSLTVAALYMYLHQEPLGLGLVAFNDAEINKPGHIGVFQSKLEFPTANNAMRIPLSFTYSNRTELINETDVRGQIGISFNLDALFVDRK